MKAIALTLPLAASLLFGSAAEAASPRTELLAGVGHNETVIAVRHGQETRYDSRYNSRYDGRNDNRHDNRYDKGYNNRHEGQAYRQARRYAAEAVGQAREARQLGFYPDHPRWSMNFERHFNWALGVSQQTLQREHYRRSAELREWRRQTAYYRYGQTGYRHPY